MVSPQAKREAVAVLLNEHHYGVTRACGLIAISRSLYRYRSRRPACTRLRERIGELAATKRRYGYRRIHVLLKREGWTVNVKKTYRLYREAGLAVRRRKRKRIGPFERKPLPQPASPNVSWSMDFVADGLADGRRLRCLAIVVGAGVAGLVLGLAGVPVIGLAAALGLVGFFVVAVFVHVRARVLHNIAFPMAFLLLAVASVTHFA